MAGSLSLAVSHWVGFNEKGHSVTKPLLILDQHFRRVDELFDAATFARMKSLYRVAGGEDRPMEDSALDELLPEAEVLIAARPRVTAEILDRAPHLKTVIEVSGAFHEEIDYSACFERGVEVLSCSPGFRQSVAEMGLSMILAGGRGLIAEHEAFRLGKEAWLDDREATDFTLYRQRIGFVGYGNIARELHRLIAPFSPSVSFYDPWVPDCDGAQKEANIGAVFANNRVVVVTATPTSENRHAIGTAELDAMTPGALLVLLGRAHVIDFDAALAAAKAGRITFATDVYPMEPVAQDHEMRELRNVILSPHRAAAVSGGRQLIGEMIVHDLKAIQTGSVDRALQPADADKIAALVAAQKIIETDGQLPGT